MNPYFKIHEAENYAFYKVPKVLLTDEKYIAVSIGVKMFYGLLLDRMQLSVENGWIDDENRVYIYFPVEEIMEKMHCKSEKAVRMLGELDGKRGIGLIEKKRQGQGKPQRIYVKNFAAIGNETLSEKENGKVLSPEFRFSKL